MAISNFKCDIILHIYESVLALFHAPFVDITIM